MMKRNGYSAMNVMVYLILLVVAVPTYSRGNASIGRQPYTKNNDNKHASLQKVVKESAIQPHMASNRGSAGNRMSVDNVRPDVMSISGRVMNEEGETLVGASVLLKGTSIGTTTDVSGSYSMEVADPNGILVFSYIGYETQEISINNRQVINASLLPDVQALKEIQIVGYGTQAKAEDRKSTRLNSSHLVISYAVFCLKKK